MLDILFNAFVVQCFTYMMCLFTEDGMIFQSYGHWLDMKRDEWQSKSNAPFWGEPLFGCSICTNVWVSFFSYFLFYAEFDIRIMIAHVFISTYLIYKLNK